MKLDDLAKFRNEILWWEICSILHDVGKLSDEFIWYRQNWHTLEHGWAKRDPHDHQWFDNPDPQMGHDRVLDEFPQLKQLFLREFTSGIGGKLSVWNAVQGHAEPGDDPLLMLLKQGDGIDSQYDRNNPLIGCEQTNHANGEVRPAIYRSNVFGYESEETRVVAGVLDRARQDLYRELQTLLAPYLESSEDLSECDYCKVRTALRKHFRPGLSDTTRPSNDTDLWEHTYSVASITKALHIAQLLSPEKKRPEREQSFRIWGFGFDSLRYLSFSHKIGDLLGRRRVLEEIFDEAEHLMEYRLPLGNVIYRDSSFLLFIVPPLPDEIFGEELREKIIQISLRSSDHEMVPAFTLGPPTEALTGIVGHIKELRNKAEIPLSDGGPVLIQGIRERWGTGGESVCSVCRARPARTDQQKVPVCRKCLQRRQNWTESFDLADKAKPTPMISEIAAGGRAVMIVAKFGLSRWLG